MHAALRAERAAAEAAEKAALKGDLEQALIFKQKQILNMFLFDALREAREEIGLPETLVEIWGRLPPHETVTGFTVTPILARVTADFMPAPEAGEVDEVFTVPLAHVLDRGRYGIERRLWRGTWRHYYAVPFGPYYIWGATARILRGLAERAAP